MEKRFMLISLIITCTSFKMMLEPLWIQELSDIAHCIDNNIDPTSTANRLSLLEKSVINSYKTLSDSVTNVDKYTHLVKHAESIQPCPTFN